MENIFIKATTLSCSPNKLLFLKTWCLGSVVLIQIIFPKFLLQNNFHNKINTFIWLEMAKSSFLFLNFTKSIFKSMGWFLGSVSSPKTNLQRFQPQKHFG